MANKQNFVLPLYVDPQDCSLRSFNKARYQHISNAQRDKLLRSGLIELVDLSQRLYRQTARALGHKFYIVSSPNGSGAVSMAVPESIRHILASEITGMHAASIPTSA